MTHILFLLGRNSLKFKNNLFRGIKEGNLEAENSFGKKQLCGELCQSRQNRLSVFHVT